MNDYNDLNQLTNRIWNFMISWDYHYDNNGNLQATEIDDNPDRIYTWNNDNRLTYVEDNSGYLVQYIYDVAGRRTLRKILDSGVWTKYYYDGLTVVAEKQSTDNGQNWSWKRIMAVGAGETGQIFSISEYNGSNRVHEYYHYDAIGNVACTTNASANLVSAFDQDAYGNVMTGSQDGYHLTTKEYGSQPDLYYFWQRWYEPEMGRFLSKAPYPPDQEHPFGFCEKNPLKYIDPTGLLRNYPGGNPSWIPGPYDPPSYPFGEGEPTFCECVITCSQAGNPWLSGMIGGAAGVASLPYWPDIEIIGGATIRGIGGAAGLGAASWFVNSSLYCSNVCFWIRPRPDGEWD